jgi:hypothetical protein
MPYFAFTSLIQSAFSNNFMFVGQNFTNDLNPASANRVS